MSWFPHFPQGELRPQLSYCMSEREQGCLHLVVGGKEPISRSDLLQVRVLHVGAYHRGSGSLVMNEKPGTGRGDAWAGSSMAPGTEPRLGQ